MSETGSNTPAEKSSKLEKVLTNLDELNKTLSDLSSKVLTVNERLNGNRPETATEKASKEPMGMLELALLKIEVAISHALKMHSNMDDIISSIM